MIKDSYGRPVTNIRISITQRCNLNCFYCHLEGENYVGHTEMSPEEIQKIVKIASSLGIKEVKLTGGEPLLRSDVLEIVCKIKAVPGITEVAITTNGTLLKGIAKSLKEAGLTRVNISLDTLNRNVYQKITGKDLLQKAVEGIKEAASIGLFPVKINMVMLNGINENQIQRMMQFAKENVLILQLIEFETANEDEIYKNYHLDMTKIEDELKKEADKVMIRSMHHRKKYLMSSGVEVETVKPMHNTEFCKNCTRMRVTSDGKLKPCLFRSDNLVDFLTHVRNGASDEALRKLFFLAVKRRKPYFTQ